MKTIINLFLFSGRILLASVAALSLQIWMIVQSPSYLLSVQEKVKSVMSSGFSWAGFDSQYRVAYNFIGGDNILVHTLFVMTAYLVIMLIITMLIWIWSRKRNS